MTKITAIIASAEEWTVDSEGKLDEYHNSFDGDRGDKIDYYLCDCGIEFKTWKEAKKHKCDD